MNATLDEERVPLTHCMRTCTVAVAKISYNGSNDTAKKYRAEIELVTQAEGTAEVVALHRDILDNRAKLSPDIKNADSDAGSHIPF
ncbi:hypothetical protein CCUS01_08070 [Colletotrichum cuscutae]|uniref:Uncharacterized protein n=1 Tax=Colletotrichum cuscutae TaxID=1209917 RepID=A0AAI9XYU3_9PEZI|nr:hypothetical protein CCUS01_08070 [Colletotrichum cuscutae]